MTTKRWGAEGFRYLDAGFGVLLSAEAIWQVLFGASS